MVCSAGTSTRNSDCSGRKGIATPFRSLRESKEEQERGNVRYGIYCTIFVGSLEAAGRDQVTIASGVQSPGTSAAVRLT